MKMQHLGLCVHGMHGMYHVEKRRSLKTVSAFSNSIHIYLDSRFFTVPGSEWTKVIVAEYQVKIKLLKKAATITQQTLDYVTMFWYIFNHLLPELISKCLHESL